MRIMVSDRGGICTHRSFVLNNVEYMYVFARFPRGIIFVLFFWNSAKLDLYLSIRSNCGKTKGIDTD